MESTYNGTNPVVCELHRDYGGRTGDVAMVLETFTSRADKGFFGSTITPIAIRQIPKSAFYLQPVNQ